MFQGGHWGVMRSSHSLEVSELKGAEPGVTQGWPASPPRGEVFALKPIKKMVPCPPSFIPKVGTKVVPLPEAPHSRSARTHGHPFLLSLTRSHSDMCRPLSAGHSQARQEPGPQESAQPQRKGEKQTGMKRVKADLHQWPGRQNV